MGPLIAAMRAAMSPQQETHGMWTEERQIDVLRGAFDNYYSCFAGADRSAVFDTNRRWCADASVIAHLYPTSRIICCVREPEYIVNSFEHLIRKNPVAGTAICNNQNTTVFTRVPIIMAADGVVGYALNAFRDAWYGPEKKRLYVIEYKNLAAQPHETMDDLTLALNLPAFKYDFDNIRPIPGAKEFDRSLRLEGLHDLSPTVMPKRRALVLPPDIVANLPKPFWR
jgi:sulfotransferase